MPVALLDAIIVVFGTAGRVLPAFAAKAGLTRIGRYYATESMLVLDPKTGHYDADATPSTGSETLFDYYARVLLRACVKRRRAGRARRPRRVLSAITPRLSRAGPASVASPSARCALRGGCARP